MRKSLSQRNYLQNKKTMKETKKNRVLNYIWSDKAFKVTVVNRAVPSLHGESLEITLTVPSNFNFFQTHTYKS